MNEPRTVSASAARTAPSLLFASDLHVAQEFPQQATACLRLLALCAQAPGLNGLYLLGDIFDLWLGDDDDREPHLEIEHALRTLAGSGTPVFVQRGNHDLLLGDDFARRTGAQLLADEHCLSVDGERVLLMHGDLLCTDDVEYLAFRANAHQADQQAQFLSLPLAQRIAVAADLRKRSRSHTTNTHTDIMDVTQQAVEAALARHSASTLVHGHTHRPATHQISTPAGMCTRRVLGDWHRPPSVLAYTRTPAGGEFETLGLDSLEQRVRSAGHRD